MLIPQLSAAEQQHNGPLVEGGRANKMEVEHLAPGLDEVENPLHPLTQGETLEQRISAPHKPTVSYRRPLSAGTARNRAHFISQHATLSSMRPGSAMTSRRMTDHDGRMADDDGLSDKTFVDFLMRQVETTNDAALAARSDALRHKLLAFAQTERVYADKDRLLRQLEVHRRRQYGQQRRYNKAEDAEALHEVQLARSTATVVSKIRSFYADLRAERTVLQRVSDQLKDQMRESIIEKERAVAAAAAAGAAREAALSELSETKTEAKSAIEDARTTMAAAAQASASACSDAARLRVELDAMRLELRNARNAEEEMRRVKVATVEDMRARVEQEASRSRELAEYGARMHSKVNGAEQEVKNTLLRAQIAEERAARLGDVAVHNATLTSEIERLKGMLMSKSVIKSPKKSRRAASPKRKGSSKVKARGTKKSPKKSRARSPKTRFPKAKSPKR